MATRGSRRKGLELGLVKMKSLKDDLIAGGAPNKDINRLELRIDQAGADMKAIADEKRAKAALLKGAHREAKTGGQSSVHQLRVRAANQRIDQQVAVIKRLAAAGKSTDQAQRRLVELQAARELLNQSITRQTGKPVDKFALVVGRSDHLTMWHYRVGSALRDLDQVKMPGSGGGLSGQAGDGDGHDIKDRGVDGGAERGEAHYGTLAVPGVVSGDDLAGWQGGHAAVDDKGRKLPPPRARTFKPKGVKAVKRASDGGMVQYADAGIKRDRIWFVFMEAAEKAGLEACGRTGCSVAAQEVIRGDSGISQAQTLFVKCRKTDGLRGIEIAMAVGLDAVSHMLGFGL